MHFMTSFHPLCFTITIIINQPSPVCSPRMDHFSAAPLFCFDITTGQETFGTNAQKEEVFESLLLCKIPSPASSLTVYWLSELPS